MLCEFLFFSLQLPHLCNMKQKGYQNAAFGCFVLIPFYDIVSFTAATTITRISSSLSATLHSFLISDFFSTPIAKQKEAWYNMTRRTEMVIWMVNELGFYRLWNRTTSQGAVPSHWGWRKPQWISWQRLSVSQNARFINSTNPRSVASLSATTVWGLILTVSHKE